MKPPILVRILGFVCGYGMHIAATAGICIGIGFGLAYLIK